MVPAAALLLLGLNSGLLLLGVPLPVLTAPDLDAVHAVIAVTAVTVSLGERGRRRARVAS